MVRVIFRVFGMKNGWLKMNLLIWVVFVLFICIAVISVGQVGRMNRLDIAVKEVIVVSGEMFSVRVIGISVFVVVV